MCDIPCTRDLLRKWQESPALQASLSSLSSAAQSVAATAAHVLDLGFSLSLFYFRHNFFVTGCVIGFVFDKEIAKIVEKVELVVKTKRSLLETFVLFSAAGLAALTSRQTTLIVITLYRSAKVGCQFYQSHKPPQGPASLIFP